MVLSVEMFFGDRLRLFRPSKKDYSESQGLRNICLVRERKISGVRRECVVKVRG